MKIYVDVRKNRRNEKGDRINKKTKAEQQTG